MPVDDDLLATAGAFEAALFVPSRVSGLGAGLIGRSAGIAEQQLDQVIADAVHRHGRSPRRRRRPRAVTAWPSADQEPLRGPPDKRACNDAS
jgi:hypothetical protein